MGLFTAIAFLWSWPIFFVVDAWLLPTLIEQENTASAWLVALFGHLLAMAGPGLAAIVVMRGYHKDPLPVWKWGHLRHYIIALVGMSLLWLLPVVLGAIFGNPVSLREPFEDFVWIVVFVSVSLLWVGGISEEMGWIAFLVPRLSPHIGNSRAMLVSGTIRGLWHWPLLVGPLVAQLIGGELAIAVFITSTVALTLQLIISNIAFGSLFGWVWLKTESLPLLGWMHQWYDAARDLLALFIVGYTSSAWFRLPGILIILIGAIALLMIARREGANMWTLAPPQRAPSDT